MEIEIRLFATLRDYLPQGVDGFSFKRGVPPGTTAGNAIEDLRLPANIPKIILLRGNHIEEDYVLEDGDVISIFPPLAGG